MTTNIPYWQFLLLLIGFIIGTSFNFSCDTDNHDNSLISLIEMLVIPLYTLMVVFYFCERTYFSSFDKIEHSLGQALPMRYAIASPKNQKKQKDQKQKNYFTSQQQHREGLKDNGDRIDLTGKYKLISSKNLENFLAAQGVPWGLRKVAKCAKPNHNIKHSTESNTITIGIESGKLYKSETTYKINGPPVQCSVRGRLFNDTITYLPSNDGIQIHKRCQNENDGDGNKQQLNGDYDVIVQRKLSLPEKTTMTVISRAIFQEKENIEAQQVFERIG